MRIWAALLSCLILLAGCTSVGKRRLWTIWNPATWGADKATQLENARTDTREAQDGLIAISQELYLAAEIELEADPAPSPFVARALGYQRRASTSLAAAVGPVAPDRVATIERMVHDLRSQLANEVARGQQALARYDRHAGELVADKRKAEARAAELEANLGEAYRENRALANQVRNFWFIVIGLGFLFVAGNVLALLSRFIPALAPISTAVNAVATPALAFAHARATAGLQRVGRAITTVREKMPEVADRLTDILDAETDEDHQTVIRYAAKTAPRT